MTTKNTNSDTIIDLHDVQAEKALLASILQGYILPADLQLSPDDFYIRRHGWIFAAMIDIHRNGNVADMVTLPDLLEKREQLKDIGGSAYLMDLGDLAHEEIHPSNSLYFAEKITECANRRKLVECINQASILAYDMKEPGTYLEAVELLKSFENGRGPSIGQWQWKGLSDLLEPQEPVEYLVNGLIPKQSLTLVFGADGSMKSMLMQDCAVCVTSGKEWLVGLDNRTNSFTTRPATVLWYDADMGEYLLKERFNALMRGHRTQPDRLHYISFPTPLFDASEDLSIERFVAEVIHFGAEMVVFDNLSTISGDKDENSPEIIEAMKRLKQIAEITGAAVVIIHHATKKEGGYRGHGRIRQTADLALKIERPHPTSEVVNVIADKVRRKPVKPFAGLFTYENLGDVLTEARYFGTIPQLKADKENKVNEAKEAVKELLQEHNELNQSAICKELNEIASRVTVRNALDELTSGGILITHNGTRNSVLYQLKP